MQQKNNYRYRGVKSMHNRGEHPAEGDDCRQRAKERGDEKGLVRRHKCDPAESGQRLDPGDECA